jgi:competence protein ComFC
VWKMQSALAYLKKAHIVLDMLFPSSCPVCEKSSDDHRTSPLCSSCWKKIHKHNGGGCRICASVTDYDSTAVCKECRSIKPVFDRVIAYGIYDGVMKETVHLMKFKQLKRLAKVLGQELTSIDVPTSDSIVPVPLSIKGLRKREFNQSAIMARELSKKTGIPLYLNGLRKVKETLPQSSLSKNERVRNVKGAYISDGGVQGKRIILVDDVVTTAATVNECAKVLKKAGASTVVVVAAARAKNS